MSFLDIYTVMVSTVRIVAIYCITQAAMHFENPWLLLIYLAVPLFSHFGGFGPAPEEEDKNAD